MCQHMPVMSVELPPQKSNIGVIAACFLPLRRGRPGSRSEPAKGSPKAAQICATKHVSVRERKNKGQRRP